MIRSLLILVLFLAACNNSSTSTADGKDTSKTITGFTWTQADENEFLLDCSENAKGKYGDSLAYIKCNCVLKQIKLKYPSLDSASGPLADSAQAAEFAKLCQ